MFINYIIINYCLYASITCVINDLISKLRERQVFRYPMSQILAKYTVVYQLWDCYAHAR